MHVATPEDRTIAVPAGHIVRTGYVPIHAVRMACRDRMAVGDVEAAYRRQLCLGSSQAWPPPVVRWDGEVCWLIDGRHQFIAALCLGMEHLFVAWLESA